MYLKKQHFEEIMQDNNFDLTKDLMTFQRLSANAAAFGTGSRLYVIYVNTIVFALSGHEGNRQILLNNGGWQTVTTKKWINWGLDRAYTNKYIMQKNYRWYLVDRKTRDDKSTYIPFSNLMVINK